jgi:hypothetical protein
MSTSQNPGGEPTEEELRAAYEAQLSQLRVEHIILDNVVMLINLGMRRTGLQPGTEDERDPTQVRLAVDSVRALLPQVEVIAPNEAGQIRDALSQLQMAYVRIGGPPAGEGERGTQPPAPGAPDRPGPAPGQGAPPGGAAPGGPPPGAPAPGAPGEAEPEGPGPAQRSGRLWIPGQ